MAKEVKVWGEGTKGLWSFGKIVNIPASYVEVRSGDAFLTRKIKELAKTVYIRMKRSKSGGYSSAVGVLAPTELVEAAKVEASRSKADRQKKRASTTAYRAKKEVERKAEVKAMMLEMYPNMPPKEAGWIVDHAFEVGSGRVGRTSLICMDEKIELAVQAYIRHTHTEYDSLLNDGWSREDAREAVAGDIARVLDRWAGEGGSHDQGQVP